MALVLAGMPAALWIEMSLTEIELGKLRLLSGGPSLPEPQLFQLFQLSVPMPEYDSRLRPEYGPLFS